MQDSVVVSSLPLDEPLANLLRLVVIHCRARLHFVTDLTAAGRFLPTHLFVGVPDLEAESDRLTGALRTHAFVWRARYELQWMWKKFWISWGAQTPGADRQSFAPVRIDFGPDLHFIFCAGTLDPEIHERLTVLYGKPISRVFVPNGWGNLGFALPCDIKFTKYGTLGGPIAPLVRICPETQRLIGIIGDQERIRIDVRGQWDEEGSLFLLA